MQVPEWDAKSERPSALIAECVMYVSAWLSRLLSSCKWSS